ncbi:hypothetical protein D3C72_1833430 [compost metagenome]
MRGRVDDQRHIGRAQRGGVGPVHELDAADGFIAAQVQVGRFLAHVPGVDRRHPGQRRLLTAIQLDGLFAACRHMGAAIAASFLVRTLGPMARHDEVGGRCAATPHEIHGNDGVFPGTAALHEHDRVIGGQAQKIAQVGFRFIADLHEVLAAMGHFHH